MNGVSGGSNSQTFIKNSLEHSKMPYCCPCISNHRNQLDMLGYTNMLLVPVVLTKEPREMWYHVPDVLPYCMWCHIVCGADKDETHCLAACIQSIQAMIMHLSNVKSHDPRQPRGSWQSSFVTPKGLWHVFAEIFSDMILT